MNYKPTILIIRDGWGENNNPNHDPFNAIKQANTPHTDAIRAKYLHTEIAATGLDVGLPPGVMGNSEVGHQNIGAGRIADQELVRISKAFSENKLKENPIFKQACKRLKKGGKLHLFGLISDAGVHSMLDHLYGLLEQVKKQNISAVYIHAFTDGRDTFPTSGVNFVHEIEAKCKEIGIGRIATICGRFWCMDRDKRWDRVEKAYNCLTGKNVKNTAPNAQAAVQHYYDNPIDNTQKGDEFIPPTQITEKNGTPIAIVEDGDTVIFYNFRADRPRELTHAFIQDQFDHFKRGEKLDLYFATMTEYEKGLCPNVLFPKPPKMKNILGTYLSDLHIPQFRCAETEKYAHVTFFFNDYRDDPLPGETRQLIPSPTEVATYDLKPQMSAQAVCEATKQAILSQKYGLIIVNFANLDMVGHTGSIPATIKACETVDSCLSQLIETVLKTKTRALITADHGNAEQMFDLEHQSPHTAHTLNPVETIIIADKFQNNKLRENGRLADIAPTLLKLMELEQPPEMTGQSLI
jgi:2,3-bisphosphoglycerate-independent phosphoglycerate mutase